MPRLDRRFTGIDMLRVFDRNLPFADKQLVAGYFFSLIPVKEPKVDFITLALQLISLIPGASLPAQVFRVTAQTAQAIRDILDLFDFEIEETELELARAKLEIENLTDELRRRRDERADLVATITNLRGDIDFLNDRIFDLEEEIRRIERESSEREAIDPEVIEMVRETLSIAIPALLGARNFLQNLPPPCNGLARPARDQVGVEQRRLESLLGEL